MTTEKRFTSFIEDDGYWIRDERSFKIIATGLKFGVAENLIAMLNELNDENIELHIQNDFLKDENQHMRELVNENEQLKQAISDWKGSYDELYENCGKLEEENEQLKECLNEAKNDEK